MKNIEKEYMFLRDEVIKSYFSSLNQEQAAAALTNSNMVLTAACPGAGKTQVIVNRIIYLANFGLTYKSTKVPCNISEENLIELGKFLKVKSGSIPSCLCDYSVPCSQIAVITFTKAAAVNMRDRYTKISGCSDAPFFGTIHSLFYRMLKEYKEFTMISEKEQYTVVKGILCKYADISTGEEIRQIINELSIYKSRKFLKLEYKTKVDYQVFMECYNAYEAYKDENSMLDFNDIIICCIRLFETNKDLLKKYRSRFKHILVDEFQDCDSEQIYMLQLLSKGGNLFAVGDEDQCIYGFRGSRPECMVDFESYFKGGIKHILNKNYRSRSKIIETSKKIISNNKQRNNKEMVGVRLEQGTVSILNFKTEREQAEALVEIIKAYGLKPSECAVLSRTNQEAEKLICAFIRNKINFNVTDKNYNFFNLDICRDIAAYFRLSQDPCSRESFIRIINKPCRYISKVITGKIKSCKSSRNWFSFLKEDLTLKPWQLKQTHVFERNTKKLGKLSPEKALNFLLDKMKYREEVPFDKQDILAEFMDMCREYKTIAEFLDYIDIQSSKLNEDNQDAVVLSTIHGSKGLEYKNVFIINCNNDNMPHQNSKGNIEEERRLFYVAVTRAADNLHIMYSENYKGSKAEPSPFIKECM